MGLGVLIMTLRRVTPTASTTMLTFHVHIYGPPGWPSPKESKRYATPKVEYRVMTPLDAWLQAALADADRRGLPELKPMLEALARATRALRAADFNQSPVSVDRRQS